MLSIFDSRLLALQKHLYLGQLSHTVFSFTDWSKKAQFGSKGCALCECPHLFPDHWDFYESASLRCHIPRLRGTAYLPVSSAMMFFNLTLNETYHLFNPDSQNLAAYGGSRLSGTVSRYQVADNIKAFLEKRRGVKPEAGILQTAG